MKQVLCSEGKVLSYHSVSNSLGDAATPFSTTLYICEAARDNNKLWWFFLFVSNKIV